MNIQSKIDAFNAAKAAEELIVSDRVTKREQWLTKFKDVCDADFSGLTNLEKNSCWQAIVKQQIHLMER